MRLLTGRAHPNFNLNGGLPQGIKTVVRAAKDSIAEAPQDETINALLRDTLCRAKLDRDTQQWKVESVLGMVKMLPYGASLEMWQAACKELLAGDMSCDESR